MDFRKLLSRRERRAPRFLEALEGRRLLAGVALDLSYSAATGGHAIVDTATPASLRGDYAAAMLLQPDGKVIVAGTAGYSNIGAGLVARLNADGTPDTSFGRAGKVLLRMSVGTNINAAQLLGDGKILLAGTNYQDSGFVTRLNPDGSLDTTFAQGGTARLSGVIGSVYDLIVLSDGNLLLAGTLHAPSTTTGDWSSPATLVRMSAEGVIDTSFGTSGRVTWNQNQYNQWFDNLTQLSPTNVLATTPVGTISINPKTGALGTTQYQSGLDISRMLALPDGSAAAIGSYTPPNQLYPKPMLMRLTPTGALNTSVYTGGMVALPIASTAKAGSPTAFSRLPDGSFAIWLDSGAYSNPATLLRVTPAGTVDTTFNGVGGYSDPIDKSLTQGGGSPATWTAVDSQGRLISALASRFGLPVDGTNGTDNIIVARYWLDMGVSPVITLPTTPQPQGGIFSASAAGTTSAQQAIVKYEWDADYTPGGLFTPDTTGVNATLTATRALSQTVGLRVTLADGSSMISTAALAVTNVAPTISVGPASGVVSQPIFLPLTVTDPGTETFTVTVDPGDGSAVKTYTNWKPTTAVTVSYSTANTYTVKVTVTDSGGASASTTRAVSVDLLSGLVVDAGNGNAGLNATVFVDTNRNGLLDTNEYSTPTTNTGLFYLPTSASGSYQLGVIGPAGYSYVGTAADLQFSLPLSTNWTPRVLKMDRVTSVAGVVYADQNSDGANDLPLTGVAGATVWLDLNNDGKLDPTEPQTISAAQTGAYKLIAPGDGTYRLRVLNTLTIAPTAVVAKTVTLALYQTQTGVSLTARRKLSGSTVHVTAYFDSNGNGVRDINEPGISGIKGQVVYTDYNGAAMPFTTSEDGSVNVASLTANRVTTTLNLSSVYQPVSAQISTLSGTDTAEVAFGLRYAQPAGAISGTVFNDLNANDTMEGGESRLTLKAYADLNDNGVLDANEPSGSNYSWTGLFTLYGVPTGAWKVRVVNTADFTYPHNDTGRLVTVAADQTTANIDLGVKATQAPLGYVADILGPSQIAEGQNGTFTGSGNWHNVSVTGFEWDLNYQPSQSFDVDATGYTINFGSALHGVESYTIAGRSVDANGSRSDVLVYTFNVRSLPPAWLSAAPGAAYTLSGHTLSVMAGSITLLSDVGAVDPAMSLVVSGAASVVSNTSQHLAGIVVGDAAHLTLPAGGNKVLRATTFNLSSMGEVDLNDNSLVVDYVTPAGQATTVRGWISNGRSGGGLASTTAQNNAGTHTTLGFMEASEYKSIYGTTATFAGEPIDDTAVLVKYTTHGDSNFDGKADFNDFLNLQNAFGQSNKTSFGGDFDYSGTTDFNDFLVLQNHFGAGLPVATPAVKPPPVTASASITGVAFNDSNRNGKYDKGDSLAAGKTVWLDLDDDGVKDKNEPSAVTDAKGRYAFKNLAAGTYHVRRVSTQGYRESTRPQVVSLADGQVMRDLAIGSSRISGKTLPASQ